jgi:hypothetical protein
LHTGHGEDGLNIRRFQTYLHKAQYGGHSRLYILLDFVQHATGVHLGEIDLGVSWSGEFKLLRFRADVISYSISASGACYLLEVFVGEVFVLLFQQEEDNAYILQDVLSVVVISYRR